MTKTKESDSTSENVQVVKTEPKSKSLELENGNRCRSNHLRRPLCLHPSNPFRCCEPPPMLYYGSMLGRLLDSEWLNMEFLTEEGIEELPRETMEYSDESGLSSNSSEVQGF